MLITGGPTPINSADLAELLADADLAQHNRTFLERIEECAYVPDERACLCLMQGEMATICNKSLQLVIGSQDATTCMVAIMACPETAVVWAAHLDYPQLGDKDVAGIKSALQQMQQPQLFLVGSYCDTAGRGPSLAQSFLQLLHSFQTTIQLQLCCVGAANTAPDGSPCCCQLALDPVTWQPQPWLFRHRGPEVARRFAAQHCRCSPQCTLLPVWDQQRQQLLLRAFDATIDSWQLMQYERLLQMPDQQLLQYMSTSPLHEPEWFPQDMRNMLQWLLSAQEQDTAECKAAASTNRYCWNGSSWQRVQESMPAAVV